MFSRSSIRNCDPFVYQITKQLYRPVVNRYIDILSETVKEYTGITGPWAFVWRGQNIVSGVQPMDPAEETTMHHLANRTLFDLDQFPTELYAKMDVLIRDQYLRIVETEHDQVEYLLNQAVVYEHATESASIAHRLQFYKFLVPEEHIKICQSIPSFDEHPGDRIPGAYVTFAREHMDEIQKVSNIIRNRVFKNIVKI